MRLIDADALTMVTEFIDGEKHEYYEKFEIDNAPTIEAISAEEHAEIVGKLCAKFVEEIKDFEPIRHGRWIKEESVGDCCYKCSECGFIRDAYLLEVDNYCPNCGVKMDEEETEDEGI